MAGSGSRTLSYSDLYKPFIKIAGRSILELSMLGLPLSRNSLTIVVNEKNKLDLLSALSEIEWIGDFDIKIVPVVESTSGQAETALIGMRSVDSTSPVLVSNCDTFFSGGIPDMSDCDGYIGTFRSSSDLYSYAKVENGVVTETAEKVVISNRATAGIYYFSSAALYEEAYLKHEWSGERYISPMYNTIIKSGGTVKEFQLDTVVSLGTTSEIEKALTNDYFVESVKKSLTKVYR